MTHAEMLEQVAQRLNTTVARLTEDSFRRHVLWPRQDAWLILNEEYGMNPNQIATLFGHARRTVVCGLETARQRRAAGHTFESPRPCRKCGGPRVIETVRASGDRGEHYRAICTPCRLAGYTRRYDRLKAERPQATAVKDRERWGDTDTTPRQSVRDAWLQDQRRARRLAQLPECELRFLQDVS